METLYFWTMLKMYSRRHKNHCFHLVEWPCNECSVLFRFDFTSVQLFSHFIVLNFVVICFSFNNVGRLHKHYSFASNDSK